MGNTLTGLIPTLYEALNRVSRELVGFIPAVRRDSNAERAALNQEVRVPLAEAGALESISPGANPPDSGDTTVDYVDVKITKSFAAPIRWNGEEQLAVGHTGTYNSILADQFTDGMRKLVNAVEIDLGIEAKISASRAYGTASTAPFGVANDLSDVAAIAQILEDNGAPLSDLQLVLGSAAISNLRGKQSVLFKVNEAGSSDMLRDGMTDRLQGFALRNSAGVKLHTAGDAADVTVDGAHEAGDTEITVSAFAAGAFTPGDIALIKGQKYVVISADPVENTITIGKPGLMANIPGGTAVSLTANYTPNVGFSRSALVLATRAPAVPEGGDSADDAMTITDPLTGLTFEVRVYRQYRQVKYEVCMAWGTKGIKEEHTAILIG